MNLETANQVRENQECERNDLIYPLPPKPFNIHNSKEMLQPNEWKNFNTHDPHIFKDEASGYYYIYSTDLGYKPGIHIRKSKDLIDWEFIGTAFLDGVPKEASEWSQAPGLWAPDIIKVGSQYRIYYSASTFGSQQSCIGLAVSKHPEGPFEHLGIVVKTSVGDAVNAIDANIVVEHETGDHYLVFGSFWRGIRLLKLNKETGFVAEDGLGIPLATRPKSVEGAVEGAYIEYNEETGYYYLFVSYGSLSSDYHVRVGRSKTIIGPYKDYNGISMLKGYYVPNAVGLKITSGYKFNHQIGWKALGHNSTLKDEDNWYLVSHARCETGPQWPYLQIRKIVWSEKGWPLVSPALYSGETVQPIQEKHVIGEYERIEFKDLTTDLVTTSVFMSLNKDHSVHLGNNVGHWQLRNHDWLEITFNEIVEQFIVLPSWDFLDEKPTLFITGLNSHGKCIWGKLINTK